MGVFSRSWDLTKTTWNVMQKDKEIFMFPVLSVIVSLVFLVLFAVFAIIIGLISVVGGINIAVMGYFLLFILYLVLAIISTFFSVCVVYTASMRFNNKDATFGDSISFSFKRIHKIFLWAIVSATVGLIIKILENMFKKAKGIGRILGSIFTWILGALWTISTIFVIQGIVYKDLGPFAAIKESVLTLKKTWGESLVKYLGFGAAEFLIILPAILIFIPLIIVAAISFGSVVLVMILALLLVAYFVAVVVFFNIADDVFNTALYIYANTGVVPGGYSSEQLKSTFRSEKKPFSPLQ